MLVNALLVAHILVVGYWLGSDLVINSTFRYVSRAASMPYDERDKLLDHVLDIDQHVRYALVLQIGFGTALAALLGYVPGGAALAAIAGISVVAWLALVESAHRLRKGRLGEPLARLDRSVRYLAVIAALVIGISGMAGYFALAGWLSLKLLLVAGAIVCGLGIRFELVRYFRVWHEIRREASSVALERLLRRRYATATALLVMLWAFVTAIVAISVFKHLIA